MRDVYIQTGYRTPIGISEKQFATIRPEFLGAEVLNAIKDDLGEQTVHSVICGNAVGTGGNIGRLTTLYSEYGQSVPALTIDMQCVSASAAICFAFLKIKTAMADCVIAGGIESCSLQPMRTYAPKDSRNGDYTVAQFSPDSSHQMVMIEGAERVASIYNLNKTTLNNYALISHQKAYESQKLGLLNDIILPMSNKIDQGIRTKITAKILDRIPPILNKSGSITAGNSCLTHDAAAFLALSHQKSNYRIIDCIEVAGDPKFSPQLILKATQNLLDKNRLNMIEIDAIEWNEAFSVIDYIFETYFPNHIHKYNQFGGAIAYGHPYGCSGCINLLHLMQALKQTNGHLGLTAIAGAGGIAMAILIEYLGDK
ncbi:MAG: thiolase family protein [Streptococcus sp.]|nr:thiolase family protein [Streptococcus sp.]